VSCSIGYEVSFEVRSLKTTRNVVFTKKQAARDFKKKWPGATIRAVEICDDTGKITRRGKRTFTGRRKHRVRRRR
jgi:hypothetical protein